MLLLFDFLIKLLHWKKCKCFYDGIALRFRRSGVWMTAKIKRHEPFASNFLIRFLFKGGYTIRSWFIYYCVRLSIRLCYLLLYKVWFSRFNCHKYTWRGESAKTLMWCVKSDLFFIYFCSYNTPVVSIEWLHILWFPPDPCGSHSHTPWNKFIGKKIPAHGIPRHCH